MKFPNIEAERARMGLSKEELAKHLGIAPKTYYNWLKGANPMPCDALVKMSELFKVKTDYLFGLAPPDEKGA